MRDVWNWSLPLSISAAGLFGIVDLSFVSALAAMAESTLVALHPIGQRG
jgi:hypothetical protein